MARMKATTVDSRGRPLLPPPPPQHGQDSSGGDEESPITYEKKGKRKLPSRPLHSNSDKGAVGFTSGGGDGARNNNRRGARPGPSPKKKLRRVVSPSASSANTEGPFDAEMSQHQDLKTPHKRQKKN